ncbi:MAG: aldo/keto reductase [bacterium]|nr:aldo/keto reductase [bacterium]
MVGSSLASGIGTAAAALPTRPLGKIGHPAGIIGIGAQRLADRPLAQSTVNRIAGEAIDNGLNYIDTARGYGRSEELLGPALKGKRDRVFLVSKTRSPTREGAMKDIEESLRKLQTDHIDCYHIHNFGRTERFPDADLTLSEDGTLGALREAKKQGKILHIGATSHMRTERVLRAFATDEIEVFMCQLNFVERHLYNFEEKVLPEARRRGIAIIGMKVLGGPLSGDTAPRLASPDDYRSTLRYVWGLPGVAVAIVGMRSLDELRQGLETARAYKPLTKMEMAGLTTRGKAMAEEWGLLRGPLA